MTTAVAEKKITALSNDIMDDLYESAGEGASYDSSELEIPFIRVAQAMSPQLRKKEAEYIAGLEQGDIYNKLTSQFWSGETGIEVIPCYQTTKYIEFIPEEQGGGYVGELAPNDPAIKQATRVGAKTTLPNGNELVNSDQHFCLVLGEEGMYQPAVIDFKSTQLKISRRWKSMITMQRIKHPKHGLVQPPLIGTIWRLRTVEESNDRGTWFNYAVEKVKSLAEDPRPEDRDLLIAAKTFRESIAKGEVKAATDDGDSGQKSSTQNGDEIPF